MKKIAITTILILGLASAKGQEPVWTLDACMRYAIDNSTTVKKQVYTADTYKAERNAAVASFFPAASASVGAQYNYGRSIDPETNTYNNCPDTNFHWRTADQPVAHGQVEPTHGNQRYPKGER